MKSKFSNLSPLPTWKPSRISEVPLPPLLQIFQSLNVQCTIIAALLHPHFFS